MLRFLDLGLESDHPDVRQEALLETAWGSNLGQGLHFTDGEIEAHRGMETCQGLLALDYFCCSKVYTHGTNTNMHTHVLSRGGHTHMVHKAHSQDWVVPLRLWDPRRVGRGFLNGAFSSPCPGVRKRRREGGRKPLLCVLFLVRKMKWLLGANKGLVETCCFLTWGAHFFSLLFPL